MTLIEALTFSGATLLMAGVIAWLVARPFARARQERRTHEHPAE